MSLMRFLAATRSIENMKDRRSPYEMRAQNLLPKFGPVRRAEALMGSQPEQEEAAGGAVLGALAFPGSVAGGAVEPPVTTEAQSNAAGPAMAYPQGRWNFWKSTFKRRPGAEPKPALSPVQGELALDTVRVVRNDFAEAGTGGLEMPPRPEPVPERTTVRREVNTTGFLWSRITARLFGAGGTLH